MTYCMCDWDDECDGSGVLHCLGCGGDQCVCAVCFGNGELSCEGCAQCDSPDCSDPCGDDGYDSDYEDQP